MPGKHAPASPRSFYISLARALGAALGAVALMVIAVVVLLNRGDNKSEGLPIVSSPSTHATSPSPTPAPTITPTPTPKVLPPNQVTVEVLNGTTRPGLAKDTAKGFEDEGYEIVKVGNQRPTFAKSTIFYRPGKRGEALAFKEAFPQFTVLKESKALPAGTMLRVIIGGDWPT